MSKSIAFLSPPNHITKHHKQSKNRSFGCGINRFNIFDNQSGSQTADHIHKEPL